MCDKGITQYFDPRKSKEFNHFTTLFYFIMFYLKNYYPSVFGIILLVKSLTSQDHTHNLINILFTSKQWK